MKNIIIFFVVFLVGTTYLSAQKSNKLSAALDEYLKIVREELYAPSPDEILYEEKNAQEMLQLLKPYYNDTIAKVRSKAFYFTYKATYKSNNLELRKLAVYNLVLALKDEDSGNVGNIAEDLTNFQTDDFNEIAKDSLRSILHKQVFYQDKIIRLAAFAGLNDQIEYMKNNLSSGIYKTNTVIWSAHIALARLGVEDEINFCVKLVKDLPVNDDVIYELVPDLIYTRQKKAFDFLIEILNSNVKNCYSSNPENPQKILCGYRLMEFFAPVIKDFPLKVDDYGDLMVDDYEKSLETLRGWFVSKSGGYELINNTY